MNEDGVSRTVFFYGLFMDEDLLRKKGVEPRNFRLAVVEGYGLRIGARATLERTEGERVFGSLMDLMEEELELLYSEGSVADYVPVQVTAFDLAGGRIDAVSYILPMKKLSGRNPDYARALLSVAEKLGLPEEHLNVIGSWT